MLEGCTGERARVVGFDGIELPPTNGHPLEESLHDHILLGGFGTLFNRLGPLLFGKKAGD